MKQQKAADQTEPVREEAVSPLRPPGPDCVRCRGQGRIGPDTWCPMCNGDGWVRPPKHGEEASK